ncbi:hypothetical protein ACFIJ5_07570 [Haloimpatiens sp. FM7330]|uniref:hypothetical protein n=1 Tax=Haloimpatiens sp. FM7330 TaxID=3298610 RepID=UPI003624FEC7
MNKIKVRFDNEVLDVITEDEALNAIDTHYIAKELVEYCESGLDCSIYIDLEDGEIFSVDGNNSCLNSSPETIITIANIKGYGDLGCLYDIVSNFEDFNDFEKEYEDWVDGVQRDYSYDFNMDKYYDVCEAYVVEVLEEEPNKYLSEERIYSMENGMFLDDVDENILKFYEKIEILSPIEQEYVELVESKEAPCFLYNIYASTKEELKEKLLKIIDRDYGLEYFLKEEIYEAVKNEYVGNRSEESNEIDDFIDSFVKDLIENEAKNVFMKCIDKENEYIKEFKWIGEGIYDYYKDNYGCIDKIDNILIMLKQDNKI